MRAFRDFILEQRARFAPGAGSRVWCTVAAVVLLTACNRPGDAKAPGPVKSSPVLAVVDGAPITEDLFRLGWERRPGASDTPEARQALLEQMIQRSALAQAARHAGLDQDPLVIEQFESLLISRLKTVQLQPRLEAVRVSDAEIQSFYQTNRDAKFTEPEGVRVAVLWFNSRGQDPLVARYTPRLSDIRDHLIKEPASVPVTNGFGSLSSRNSEHLASRHRGGDVGWLQASPLNDAWHAAVIRLASGLTQPGDLSGIYSGPEGLFLVRLIERRAAGVQPLAAVRSRIEQSMLADRRRALEQEFEQSIYSKARIERKPDVLEGLAAAPVAAPQRRAAPGTIPPVKPAAH